MLLLFFHLLLAVGALWYHRKGDYVHRCITVVGVWYAISLVLIYLDSIILNRTFALTGDVGRGAVVSLFQLPPLYFALLWGKTRRKSLWGPVIIYVLLSFAALVVVGLFFARADVVSGLMLA